MNKTNIKQHLRGAFVALAAVGALLALPLADASRPFPSPGGAASGSFSGCFGEPDVSYIGNLQTPTGPGTITFTGTFNGTWVGMEHDEITPKGEDIAHYSGVFTGTVAGSPIGTAVFTGTGVFTGIGYAGLVHGATSLQWIVGQGTGGLAGLQANFTFSPPTGGCDPSTPCPPQDGCAYEVTANYAGRFQFAP